MIEIGQFNRDAFKRWRSCRHSGDFVKFEVKPYGEDGGKQIRQRGYCMKKKEDVDFGTDCLMTGLCWKARGKVSHSKTALQKIRAKKAAERRKRFNAKRIELNMKSKGIDEY